MKLGLLRSDISGVWENNSRGLQWESLGQLNLDTSKSTIMMIDTEIYTLPQLTRLLRSKFEDKLI